MAKSRKSQRAPKKSAKLSKKSTQKIPNKNKSKNKSPEKYSKNYSEETPEEMVARLKEENIRSIEARAKRGIPLTAPMMTQLEMYAREKTAAIKLADPPEDAETVEPEIGDHGPADVLASGFQELARLVGVHRTVLHDWKRKGIISEGEPPFSLREICARLQKGRKLRQTRPTHPGVVLIREWLLSEAGSDDPDAPDHPSPQDWEGEIHRQQAYRLLEQRKHEQLKVGVESEELATRKEVRAALHVLRDQCSGCLATCLSVISVCKTLTIAQQIELSTALQAWVTTTKESLSRQARSYAGTLRGTDDAR